MKDLLAKLLGMFHKPEPTKPIEVWPFPPVEEAKAAPKKRVAAKGVVAAAKKTAAKKTPAKKAATKKKAK